ncbi:hypothetical protein Lal_00033000 [Lupinus albus]|uniref:Uncharacterized protein n=1 Tax=Lupinus albus TaxID=3870 RepID=A0A6A4R8C4_LUPAL|nr:putative protein-serine/threonine phosphatase [Lupinus albus]KAF1898234.1 hypothetical protein Lal_00033000 [Lupinus albus]
MAFPLHRDILNPGPKDPSLLTQQNNHISSHIWSGKDHMLLPKQSYVRGPKPPEPILAMLKVAGFGYVVEIENFDIDVSLISALVERWRPETCTFHLPYGECTITLEDVALQLGIPVDGHALTGIIAEDWSIVCQELLGAVPPKNAWGGEGVALSWFANRFENLPINAPHNVVQQYTRAYIMRLIGSLLLPDKRGTHVHLMYLPLLKNLSSVGHYSWGSGVLACLYREMCHASKINSNQIGGCLVLLQAWAWDRIPSIAPKIDQSSGDQVHRGLGFPLSCRWSHCKKTTENSKHWVQCYRFSLDKLDVHEFIWTPYTSPDVRRYIPQDPGEVCYAIVPLICCAIVEWHHPDRVMRQFGLRQSIPQPPMNIDRLRKMDLKVRGKAYWPEATWINLWLQRRERLIQGFPSHAYFGDVSNYMKWYLDVTRKWISHEGALAGTMVIGVRNILRFATSETPNPIKCENIIQVCNDMLNVSHNYHSAPTYDSRQGNNENLQYKKPINDPYKQPYPMGFASYSKTHNPFSFSESHPTGPFYSVGAPPPPLMYNANPGTTTFSRGAHLHMPKPYGPPIPSFETEDEDESEDDFESEDY